MKTVLITGANGQLGSEFKKLSSNNQEKNINFIFTDIDELDITDLQSLHTFFLNNEIDFIVNCAAYTNVDKAESDEKNAELINAVAVQNLADISCVYNIPVIHISTDYVFNGSQKNPYSEEDTVNPQTAYGRTKLKGEEFIKDAYKYIIIRTSWLYSEFGHNFVKTMIRLGKEKDQINVVNDQIGSPTNAADLAAAILLILQNSIKNDQFFKSGIYHFSGEGSCSWYDFAKEIMNYAELNCKVNPISSAEYPMPAKRPEFSLLDKSKIKDVYRVIVPDWKESLKRCLDEIVI